MYINVMIMRKQKYNTDKILVYMYCTDYDPFNSRERTILGFHFGSNVGSPFCKIGALKLILFTGLENDIY